MGRVLEGKPKLSTWNFQPIANWLEKESKISESKQRWMPEKREWKRSDSSKLDRRKPADNANTYLGCLREPRENLYVPAMEQRIAQFISAPIILC